MTRDVHTRNDITVNRAMFILGGYVFDQRARYSFTVWTSAGAASIVVASNIGWQFNKALTITAGYTGVPGSRSLVNTFPFFTSTDRSMADNFFRPGFTQGVWANGELGKGLNYLAFVGNGLNTLSISANKIDTHLLLSGSVWWEPLGAYGEPGKSRNMYDDYFASNKVRIRLGHRVHEIPGGPFFESRSIQSREHVALQLRRRADLLDRRVCAGCDGRSGDLPDVGGRRRHQMERAGGQRAILRALAGRFRSRRPASARIHIRSRRASSPAGYFVEPKTVMVYGRGSWVRGQFGDSHEYGGGVKWHFLPTERLWLNAELFQINQAPYSGAFTPYTAGMTGWVPMVQTVLAF